MENNARVIALCASKGGVGKTTISTALAVRAARDGDEVAVLDAEPQQSAMLWWSLRGEPDNPQVFALDESARNVARDVARLKAQDWAWVFIDTPPAMIDRIEAAIVAADFVLVPVRASVFDVDAVQPVVELCHTYVKPFAFVLSQADPKWKLLGATIEALKDHGPVLEEMTRYRAVYASAVTIGKTGPEAKDAKQAAEAAAEIDALWRAVKRLASGKTTSKARRG
jgi:chromosome partitioning protein